MPSSILSSRSRITSLALAGGLVASPAWAQPPILPADAPTVQPASAVRPSTANAAATPTPTGGAEGGPLILAPPAPEPERVARTATELGQKAYDLGRFDEAIGHYSAAYEAMPLPALLFNIGQCHRQLGQFERAAFFYGRYLDLAPRAPNAALTQELLQEVGAIRQDKKPPPPEPPLHRRWWFWAGAGAAALAAGGAIIYATRPPEPTLGTLDGR